MYKRGTRYGDCKTNGINLGPGTVTAKENGLNMGPGMVTAKNGLEHG